MTPSQLARKRANDRVAQRAMRARNKARVESLEAEVRELRMKLSEQSSNAFQPLVARNYALETALARLMEEMRPDVSTSSLSIFHDAVSAATCTNCFGQCSGQDNAIQSTAPRTETTITGMQINPTIAAFSPAETQPASYGPFAGLGQLAQEISCGCNRPCSQHSVWGCILGSTAAAPEQKQ